MDEVKLIPGRYTSNAQSEDVKRLFGLEPKQKWPRFGLKIIVVDGWKLWVDPIGFKYQIRKHSSFKQHRAMAQCPACGKNISIGRISQHIRVHKGEA